MRMCQTVLSIVTLAISASVAFAQGGTEFTYQGRLLDAGEPADGTFNVDFRLWDDPAAGSQVGSTNTFNSLPIVEGLFTVELDFGADAFDNQDRWLEITIDGVPLVPRQPITRTPYAIQTRGIVVNENGFVGIGTDDPIARLDVRDGIFALGSIVGEYQGENGAAVIGLANAATGNTRGVYGLCSSSSGNGVYGESTASGGTVSGGFFKSRSTSGDGVYGLSLATSGVTYGGRFENYSTSGHGVYGINTANTGTNYGVYGQTNSSDGYAGYFQGGRNYFQGDVGIGNEDPEATLHVVSAGGTPQILVEQTDSGDFARLRWRVAGFPEWSVSSEPAIEPDMRWFNSTNGNVMVLEFNGDLQIDGVLTEGSDRNRKKNVEPVDNQAILRKVATLPINHWSYKSDSTGARHIGPMAQDFHDRFEVGKDEKHIGSLDASGIALAAIQALHELMGEVQAEKDGQIQKLEHENDQLRERLASIESVVEALQAQIPKETP